MQKPHKCTKIEVSAVLNWRINC